jgi:2-polyprenyl-3-methyl-5-hydroxy-6-metoxy-1,4-benzoquinol methylase
MNFFKKDTTTALQAKEKAQWIAFAPVVFQASRTLRNTGILAEVAKHKSGVTELQVATALNLPHYGVRVLMEAGLGMGLLTLQGELYAITKTAWFLLHDEMTRVNMDFVHDVCYEGMFHLDKSIQTGKPEGLTVFGEWPTIYEALAQLPEPVQKSWFAFDHFYSDTAFPDVLAKVFKHKPKQLLDIGGNTGKWAIQCCQHNLNVTVTIVDLPGQVNMAKANIEKLHLSERVLFHETNVLTNELPNGYDAIWMSQFLDCFSDAQIVSILQKCAAALTDDGHVFILEPFWDRQKFEVSAFSLQQTSLYFTAMANGNSQMYHADDFIDFINKAGLTVVAQHDLQGVSHTLLECKRTA